MNINRSDGWVKLHKKSMFSSLWQDHHAWRMFTTLLLMAHHEENFASIRFRGKQRYLAPGELSISKLELADYLGFPTNRVKDVLKRLKDDNRIDIETDNHRTIIRICKWKEYQSRDNQPKSQPTSKQDHQPDPDQTTNPNHIKRIKNKELRIKNTTKVGEFGNSQVNEVVKCFEDSFGFSLTRKQLNRQAAHRLANKYGVEKVQQAIKAASEIQEDRYAPSINNLLDLEEKLPRLVKYFATRSSINLDEGVRI